MYSHVYSNVLYVQYMQFITYDLGMNTSVFGANYDRKYTP
jgi:hypothetical protein